MVSNDAAAGALIAPGTSSDQFAAALDAQHQLTSLRWVLGLILGSGGGGSLNSLRLKQFMYVNKGERRKASGFACKARAVRLRPDLGARWLGAFNT